MANSGLVQQAQQPSDAAPVEDNATTTPEESGEEQSNLTPEEQEIYDSAMKMVGELIYANDESNQAILDLITADNPSATIAEATVFVLSKIEETFQGNYPEDLIVITADEISDLILELANESGKVTVTEEIAKDTKGQLVDQLATEYGADPEDLQTALGDVTQTELEQAQATYGGQNG